MKEMATKTSYGQFCPVAKACEVFTERWTPLIVREMFMGSQRFSDLHRGVPLMSRTLLSKRLQELMLAGVVERVESGGHHDVYRLTPAGEELGPIVVQLGHWGKQWTRKELTGRQSDPGLLMWDMRRRIEFIRVPEERIVVQFLYPDAPLNRRNWWLILSRTEADLCLVDPGLESHLLATTRVSVMTDIWMGDLSYGTALQTGELKVEGPAELRTKLPTWLKLSSFADIERHVK